MNIAGLDKAAVLAALFNGSHQQGLGVLSARGRPGLTVDQAREYLKHSEYFDYLNGRVMKIDLSDDEVDTWLYNRDNGDGAAEAIIEAMRADPA